MTEKVMVASRSPLAVMIGEVVVTGTSSANVRNGLAVTMDVDGPLFAAFLAANPSFQGVLWVMTDQQHEDHIAMTPMFGAEPGIAALLADPAHVAAATAGSTVTGPVVTPADMAVPPAPVAPVVSAAVAASVQQSTVAASLPAQTTGTAQPLNTSRAERRAGARDRRADEESGQSMGSVGDG